LIGFNIKFKWKVEIKKKLNDRYPKLTLFKV
jgi:hypothetical protein